MSKTGKPRVSPSEATRLKLSEAGKGKTLSANARQKLSEANKGKTLSEDHKRKLGEAHIGQSRPWTEEHRKNYIETRRRKREIVSDIHTAMEAWENGANSIRKLQKALGITHHHAYTLYLEMKEKQLIHPCRQGK